MKKVAIYIRYSSENQRDGYSVEYQEEECRKFCDAEGFDVARVYVDEAVSGRSAEGRASLFEMLSDVRSGEYEAVVVYKFSRFARNLLEATIYRQQIEKAGARLLSAMERIDDSTPEGRMMRNIILAMDEYYSDNLATFVQSSMHTAAKQGKYLGGEPPFGFRVDDEGNFQIHEAEADAVRRAFDLRASGMLPADILRVFRDEGIRGRSGKPFTQQLLNKIFRAEKYIGVYEYRVRGYEPVRIDGGMPAIIDRRTWDAVQVAIDRTLVSRGTPKPRSRRNVYPLTGLIRCAVCGEPFTGNVKGGGKGGRKVAYYTCRGQSKLGACSNGSIQKDELEAYVFGKIGELMLSERLLEDLADVVVDRLGSSGVSEGIERELEGLRKERSSLEGKLGALVDLMLDGRIPREVLDSRSGALREQLDAVEAAIRSKEFARDSAVTREGVLSFLRDMTARLPDADPLVRKEIARQFVESIEVGERDVSVRLTVSPGFAGDKVNGGWALFTLSPVRAKNRSGWSLLRE